MNLQLHESYDNIIKTYLSENIVEEIKDDETFEIVHCLLYRVIVRNERDTTKICVVFDASAKRSKQPSLNYILYSGLSLLPPSTEYFSSISNKQNGCSCWHTTNTFANKHCQNSQKRSSIFLVWGH